MNSICNNSNKLSYILVDDKKELLKHKDAILDLFRRVFRRILLPSFWKWLYIDNPCGDPVVSLCYNGHVLVGQYAAIPIPMKIGEKLLKVAAGCTMMVDRSFRRYGVFYETGNMVYTALRAKGFDIVIGFPNQSSAPVIKGFFNCYVNYSYVAKLTKEHIRKILCCCDDTKSIQLNFDDLSYRSWRLSKPGVQYFSDGANVFKFYEGNLELLYFTEKSIEFLDSTLFYKVIVDEKIDSFKENKLFDYYFAYKLLNEKLSFSYVKNNLLMSDVF